LKDDDYGPARVALVRPGSPAEEAGVLQDDLIWSVDGEPMRDLIDYYLLMADDVRHVLSLERGGQRRQVELDTRSSEAGIEMAVPVFGSVRTCDNSCIFCFVDQLPEGLKESVYVKDDDYRLSFLQGNFVTLTNLDDDGIERIIEDRLSPLYVSLHATDPELRRQIFGNLRAGRALENLRVLLDAGIEVHIQIVLMRGVNDGYDLEHTLSDLHKQFGDVASVGVVPVGISDGGRLELPGGFAHDEASALDVLGRLERWSAAFGDAGPFAADEFFFLAGREAPGAGYYGGFPQTENGIGLARLFRDGFLEAAWRLYLPKGECEDSSIVTTPMGAWALSDLGLEETGVKLTICENTLFGPKVNVCGLIPGEDVASALSGLDRVSRALVPEVALGTDGSFIDGMTPVELARRTGFEVEVVPCTGTALIEALWESRPPGGIPG
jgi:putative radical SAM enzyme (TIGR03279 family)